MTKEKKKILLPLINEYEYALIFCRNIRRGFGLSVDPERIKKYANWFFHKNLKFHFEMEEDFIFSILNGKEKTIIKVRSYQRKLKKLFLNQTDNEKSLSLIEELLETCIRFEKKHLVDMIIDEIDLKRLILIMNLYANSVICEDWGDRFWENNH